jgi:tetratricopeptide (TPR) repeat protein
LQPPAADLGTEDGLRTMIRWALAHAQGADFALTEAPLEQVLAASGFTAMPTAEQHLLVTMTALVAYRNKAFGRAHELAAQATAMSEATPDDWVLRVGSAVASGDISDALLSTQTICTQWRTALGQIGSEIPAIVERSNYPQYREARGALLESLYAVRWEPAISSTRGEIWLQYALHLIEQGDKERAREAASHLADPYSIIGLRADDRFKKVRGADYVLTNVPKAAAALLKYRQDRSHQNPRMLVYVVALGHVQLEQLRAEEALALADAALAAIASAPANTTPFDDQPGEYQSLLALRAEALYQLGRFSEALAQLQSAVDLPARYTHGSSRKFRLAEWLCQLDQAPAALAALPEINATNVQAAMRVQAIRADVALSSGDTEAWTTAVGELREHEADAPEYLQRALLHQGDLDGAAQVLLRRLESPEQRLATLINIQTYQEVPAPPRVRSWQAQERSLLQRADVQAAIKKIGNIDKYALVR